MYLHTFPATLCILPVPANPHPPVIPLEIVIDTAVSKRSIAPAWEHETSRSASPEPSAGRRPAGPERPAIPDGSLDSESQ